MTTCYYIRLTNMLGNIFVVELVCLVLCLGRDNNFCLKHQSSLQQTTKMAKTKIYLWDFAIAFKEENHAILSNILQPSSTNTALKCVEPSTATNCFCVSHYQQG